MSAPFDGRAEWLEADGLGGFASGTVAGTRTRRYHALLLPALTPPTGRVVLVNGFDAWVETEAGSFPLTSQRYAPGVTHPDGVKRIESFGREPWPRWTFLLEDGTRVEQEIFVRSGLPVTALAWRARDAKGVAVLNVRPFLSGRDYHSMHHQNPGFRFDAESADARLVWRPYPGVAGIVSVTNGEYRHAPDWFRNFQYDEERERGLDFTEDLASPGVLRFDLARGEAIWLLAPEGGEEEALPAGCDAVARLRGMRAAEKRRRREFASPLHRAADAYLVRRGNGKTIVAGYPWFTDWGRDTFIALRGLCLATGRLADAGGILLEWAGAVSEGMLPNRFPDRGEAPEFNSVDASLWYVVAVHEYLQARAAGKKALPRKDRDRLVAAVEAILDGYSRGTRFGIRMDDDGLLMCGEPGVQLTWMDAKVGDWVVTPRIGKPVEIQALWLNALRIGALLSPRWEEPARRALASFATRFWVEALGHLNDVADVDRRAGSADPTFRPNQVLAVGGLPFPLLEGDRARRVVDAVEARLWTPLGLRSLAPGEPGYTLRYQGGVRERDGAYHQGTVWPWLIGPFVEAWVRVRGGTAKAKAEARERFVEPLIRHLDEAGLGHVSEIADAEAPHTPRGCPFQAWSLGEVLRVQHAVLAAQVKLAARA